MRLCSATLVRSYSRVCVIARASLFLHVWRAPSKHLRTFTAVHVRVYTKDSPGKPKKNGINMPLKKGLEMKTPKMNPP